MALASMTGFARVTGTAGAWHVAWELKTVNAKGLDIRLRLPPGFDAMGETARQRIAATIQRGTCFANLSATRETAAPSVRINEPVLRALLAAIASYDSSHGVTAASLGDLLHVRGVVDVVESQEDPAETPGLSEAVLAQLDAALEALVEARRGEGAALGAILATRLDSIAALAAQADAAPARRPEAIKARLAQQVAALLDASTGLDPARLHQEAVLLATKADIREELDRLQAHVASARALLATGGPVGRRLDFLAQEFSREANTLCAKANDVSLTAIGLSLKTEVEQFREQVQNVE